MVKERNTAAAQTIVSRDMHWDETDLETYATFSHLNPSKPEVAQGAIGTTNIYP